MEEFPKNILDSSQISLLYWIKTTVWSVFPKLAGADIIHLLAHLKLSSIHTRLINHLPQLQTIEIMLNTCGLEIQMKVAKVLSETTQVEHGPRRHSLVIIKLL